MSSRSLSIDQVLTMLAEAPSRLAALTAGLAPARLQAAPSPGEWPANDVLAHLRSCADVWGGCIGKIIAQDHPSLRRLSPRTWIKQTDYLEQEFQSSLQAYTAQRAGLLAVLGPLAPGGWSRAATVKGAGKVLERTVLSYGQQLALHEQPHIEQIAWIVSTMRR